MNNVLYQPAAKRGAGAAIFNQWDMELRRSLRAFGEDLEWRPLRKLIAQPLPADPSSGLVLQQALEKAQAMIEGHLRLQRTRDNRDKVLPLAAEFFLITRHQLLVPTRVFNLYVDEELEHGHTFKYICTQLESLLHKTEISLPCALKSSFDNATEKRHLHLRDHKTYLCGRTITFTSGQKKVSKNSAAPAHDCLLCSQSLATLESKNFSHPQLYQSPADFLSELLYSSYNQRRWVAEQLRLEILASSGELNLFGLETLTENLAWQGTAMALEKIIEKQSKKSLSAENKHKLAHFPEGLRPQLPALVLNSERF